MLARDRNSSVKCMCLFTCTSISFQLHQFICEVVTRRDKSSDSPKDVNDVKMGENIRKPLLLKQKTSSILGSMQNVQETVVVLIVLFLWLTLRCCVTISSQVSGIKSNVFELNTLRFGVPGNPAFCNCWKILSGHCMGAHFASVGSYDF